MCGLSGERSILHYTRLRDLPYFLSLSKKEKYSDLNTYLTIKYVSYMLGIVNDCYYSKVVENNEIESPDSHI